MHSPTKARISGRRYSFWEDEDKQNEGGPPADDVAEPERAKAKWKWALNEVRSSTRKRRRGRDAEPAIPKSVRELFREGTTSADSLCSQVTDEVK